MKTEEERRRAREMEILLSGNYEDYSEGSDNK